MKKRIFLIGQTEKCSICDELKRLKKRGKITKEQYEQMKCKPYNPDFIPRG